MKLEVNKETKEKLIRFFAIVSKQMNVKMLCRQNENKQTEKRIVTKFVNCLKTKQTVKFLKLTFSIQL